MMKKLTIMIIAVLIGSSAIGQKYFEGKATYQMSINGFGAGSTTNVVYYRADGSYVYNTMMLKTIHFADRNESYSIMKSKDKIISIDLDICMSPYCGIYNQYIDPQEDKIYNWEKIKD